MRALPTFAGLALALLSPGLVASHKPFCTPTMSGGQKCHIAASALHPTQTSVGMMEIQEKVGSLLKEKDLKSYLKAHPVPLVIGPGGFYLTDHHHLTYAMIKSGLAAKQSMYAEIQCNWGTKSTSTFWEDMQSAKLTWGYNGQGQPISPYLLPSSVSDMTDDPYRSLSWKVRYVGFEKTCLPFAEFKWGFYFRRGCCSGLVQNCPFYEIQSVVQNATEASRRQAASGLPGYVPPPGKVSKKKPVCPIKSCSTSP